MGSKFLKTTGRNGMPLMGKGIDLVEGGGWHPVIEGDLAENVNGYHMCRDIQDVCTWAGPELWLMEGRGEWLTGEDAAVCNEQRPIARLMDEHDWRKFAVSRLRQEIILAGPSEITSTLGMCASSSDPWLTIGWPIREKLYKKPSLVRFVNRHYEALLGVIEEARGELI